MSENTLVLTYPPASRTELKLVKSVNPIDWQKVGRSQIWRGELDEPL